VKNHQIYADVKRLLTKTFSLSEDDVQLSAHLRDNLGLDSIEFMDSITVFEKHFGIVIVDKKLIDEEISIDTVQDLCALIEKKIAEKV
jgi:acyl carrier protein